jgi:hypothetical protein
MKRGEGGGTHRRSVVHGGGSFKSGGGDHRPCGKMAPGGGWAADGCFRVERTKKEAIVRWWGKNWLRWHRWLK